MKPTTDPWRSPEDRMIAALKSLPLEKASADFTPRLLRRIEHAERHRPTARSPARQWWAWPLAAAAVIGALLIPLAVKALAPRWLAGDDDAPARVAGSRSDALESLLAENVKLTSDIAELRRQVESREPLIYLGSDDATDYVYDLSSEALRRRGANAGREDVGMMPASLNRASPGRTGRRRGP